MSTKSSNRINVLATHLGENDMVLDDKSAFTGYCSNLTSQTLVEERAKASFNVRHVMNFLNGSEEATRLKERVCEQLEHYSKEIAALQNGLDYEISLPEQRIQTIDRIRAIYRMFFGDAGDPLARQARIDVANLYDPAYFTRNGVHFGLFVSAIQGQGSDEQIAEWIPKAYGMNIYGCFGMTELGHGSFVRGLETIARFIPNSGPDGQGQWDIHSPSITATKWWIGGASETATHCALYARLVTPDGEDHGVHCFLIELRDPETHELHEGVRVGDCGPKMGRHGIDNGWIAFHHARYPASAHLNKYSTVSREGKFTKSNRHAPQLAYGALINGRAAMVADSSIVLQLAVTVAVRYTAMRRQGGVSVTPTGELRESSILDFRVVQLRLLPLLATAYAAHSTAKRMRALVDQLSEEMDAGSSSALPDVHATSAGLKAFCTWTTLAGIEDCRQLLGGHGYSRFARLPDLGADFAVVCTWEGANTVMALQTARYLISTVDKCFQHFASADYGAPEADAASLLCGSVLYLLDAPSYFRRGRTGPPASGERAGAPSSRLDVVGNVNDALEALRWRARSAVFAAHARLEREKQRLRTEQPSLKQGSGSTEKDREQWLQEEAWNSSASALLEASRAHVNYNIAMFFAISVEDQREAEEKADATLYADIPRLNRTRFSLSASGTRPPSLNLKESKKNKKTFLDRLNHSPSVSTNSEPSQAFRVLHSLRMLYMVHTLVEDRGGFFTDATLDAAMQSPFTAAEMDQLSSSREALCRALRPDAVALVDAFGLSDFVLNTPLARSDGDIYRHYFANVQAFNARKALRQELSSAVLRSGDSDEARQLREALVRLATPSAAEGHPLFLNDAEGIKANKATPYLYEVAPYFETSIKPLLSGDDLNAGPLPLVE